MGRRVVCDSGGSTMKLDTKQHKSEKEGRRGSETDARGGH
jgi:hypothetical protein